MKLTKSRLQQIIKEELEKISLEEEIPQIKPEDIKKGQKLAKSKVGQSIFAELEKDPRVKDALKDVLAAVELNEAEAAKEYPGEMGGELPMTGTMIGVGTGAAAAGKVAALNTALLGTAAGKALVAAVGPMLASLGVGLAGFALPVAIGLLLSYGAHSISKKSWEKKHPKPEPYRGGPTQFEHKKRRRK